MMLPGKLRRFTATGDVNTSPAQVSYGGWTVSPGTATTTVTLREGGSSGTVIWQGVFAANGPGVAYPIPFVASGLHVTISGTAAEVSILS